MTVFTHTHKHSPFHHQYLLYLCQLNADLTQIREVKFKDTKVMVSFTFPFFPPHLQSHCLLSFSHCLRKPPPTAVFPNLCFMFFFKVFLLFFHLWGRMQRGRGAEEGYKGDKGIWMISRDKRWEIVRWTAALSEIWVNKPFINDSASVVCLHKL